MADTSGHVTLALDTSSDMLCCVVEERRDGVPVLTVHDHLCRRHSNEELMLSALDTLREAGLAMGDVDEVVCGRGPGSFTGVRIGVACAKGVSCGLARPLFGVSTLDAVAWGAWEAGVRGKLAVALDAMRGEVYPGIYVLDEGGVERTFASETVMRADACVEEWARRSDASELTLTGNALLRYRDRFEAAGLARILDEALWYPSGPGLIRCARTGTGDPALVLPLYTRLSDAEENERRRLGMAEPGSVSPTGVADAMAGVHLQLRPMSVNDLGRVAELERDAFATSAHTAWSRAQFEEELALPGRTWWVAHDSGEVVGFAGGLMAGEVLEVLDVVVESAHRREGIAARLLERVAYDAHVLGAQAITLEVSERNEAAQALYASMGLVRTGERPGYYGPGEAALIMGAELPLVAHPFDDAPGPSASIRPWPIRCAPRDDEATARIEAARPLILAIESSCD